ncbi:MAG: hypothetical protein SF182_12695 [Deltaproteobacteria bacterium]|nr:hypothetical protein [Deltaproteobacteria bacterium]
MVNEQELVRVAVFNLEQAAQRILALAGEVETNAVDSHLRALSKDIAARARELQTRYPIRSSRSRQ